MPRLIDFANKTHFESRCLFLSVIPAMEYMTFRSWQPQPHTQGEHSYHSTVHPEGHVAYDMAIDSVKLESNNHEIWNFHKCKMCPYRTKSFPLMRSHLKRHKITRQSKTFECQTAHVEQYKCSMCEYRTHYLINFNKHIGMSHCQEQVQVEQGGTTVKLPKAATNLNWRTMARTYNCENCSFTTYSQIFYVSHYRVCPVKMFLEDNNEKRLKEQERRIKWRKLQEKNKLHQISKNFKNSTNKTFVCFKCDFRTTDVHKLNQHAQASHRSGAETAPLVKETETQDSVVHEKETEAVTEVESAEKTPPKLKRQDRKVARKIPVKKTAPKLKRSDRKGGKKRAIAPPVYCCWKCPFKSFFVTGYVNHLYHRHIGDSDIGWINCDQCSYKSVFAGHLKRHIQAKHNVAIKCTMCSFQGTTRLALRVHLLEKHISSEETKSEPEEKRLFKCTLCKFTSPDHDGYKEHILTNHVATATVVCFKCQMCPYETIHEDALMEHVLEHVDPEGLDWVQCEMCDVKFRAREGLKKHIFDKHIL